MFYSKRHIYWFSAELYPAHIKRESEEERGKGNRRLVSILSKANNSNETQLNEMHTHLTLKPQSTFFLPFIIFFS